MPDAISNSLGRIGPDLERTVRSVLPRLRFAGPECVFDRLDRQVSDADLI